MILKENKMGNFVNILNINFEIIDTLEYITLADSFVKNKIGTGHGEAVLYVGSGDNTHNNYFFKDLNGLNCFFLKKDFENFLKETEEEYLNPSQNYIKKENMSSKLFDLKNKCNQMIDSFLYFQLDYVDREPPRIYMRSNSEYYEFMREIALPNISYLSILKLRNSFNGSIWYYFKIFVDYKLNIIGYRTFEEIKQEEQINQMKIPEQEKEMLIKSRIGQGKYRENLLKECPYCPFTLIDDKRLLVASHIKPWSKSNNYEKIDSKNGFIFTPTYDRLFDRGLITFDDNKKLIVSPWLSSVTQNRLKIFTGMPIENLNLDRKRKEYLKYHRENIFKG